MTSDPGASGRADELGTVAHEPPPEAIAAALAQLFYKIDSTKVTLGEYWRESRSPTTTAVAAAAKLLRARIPCSTDDLNITALAPFEVGAQSLPDEGGRPIEPLLAQLEATDFRDPIYHVVVDLLHSSRTYLVTLVHASGHALARVHLRIWTAPRPAKVYLFTEFLTLLEDGGCIWSLSTKPDLSAPPACEVHRLVGADPQQLWPMHQEALAAAQGSGRRIVSVRDAEQARWAVERHHAMVRDFHLSRGVFAPLDAADVRRLATLEANARIAAAGVEHADVLAEIQRLQQKRSGSWGNLFWLAISLALFIGIGVTKGGDPKGSRWSMEFLAVLVGVLFVHELGHYIAMRIFGYRNLRMFFIPLFGAAVSGQNYNVPGWKKAIVSLMGPVPGILLGALLGFAGVAIGNDLMVRIALVALLLNGINLLPVLPLDGGWIVHTLLFSRHYLLDVMFRVLACAALLAAGAYLQDKLLLILGVMMALAIPVAYKLAQIAAEVRRSGARSVSPDDQTVPLDVAQTIAGKVKEAFGERASAKVMAQHTLSVFETLNARPPGILATFAFGVAHLGSLFVAAFLAVLLMVAQRGGLRGIAAGGRYQPQFPVPSYALAPSGQRLWIGSAASTLPATSAPSTAHSTLVTTLSGPEAARSAFADLQTRLPVTARMRLLGQSLIIALPPDDPAAQERWRTHLATLGDTFLEDRAHPSTGFSLSCVAPDEPAAQAIEAQVQWYFSASTLSPDLRLIPPWMAADERTNAQRAQHDMARRTLHQAVTLPAVDTPSPAEELAAKLLEAQRRRDTAEGKRLLDEMLRRESEARLQKLKALRQQGPEAVDLEVLDAYIAVLPNEYTEASQRQLAQQLAPRLGQVPPDADAAALARVEGNRAAGGFTLRDGRRLYFGYLRFSDVFDGPQALLEWVRQHNCADLRYELVFLPGGGEDDEDVD